MKRHALVFEKHFSLDLDRFEQGHAKPRETSILPRSACDPEV
jgi:hypothetical protein